MPIRTQGYCSPQRFDAKQQNGTCLTLAELQSVAALYNKRHIDNQIPLSSFSSTQKLVGELDKRFKKVCKSKGDACWIKQDEVKELYFQLQKNYRPMYPKEWLNNKNMWLNTYDILHVMKQYEDTSFQFLGVFPVDFNQKVGSTCIVREMCDFKVHNFISKADSFGIVFNLDRHDQPGSHWVSTYCNLKPSSKKFGICYYDSGGVKPPKYIADFFRSIVLEVKEVFSRDADRFQVKYNNTQHQFMNTECGIFSMIFVIICKENTNETYRKSRTKVPNHDNKVHKFRQILYSPLM